MEGWLLKSSGGKGDHRKTFGNMKPKWDKRWFVLRGGSTTLHYYKTERDADKGNTPAGGVECDGCNIERVPDKLRSESGFSGLSGFDIEFILHTKDRVLNLRTDNEDTFRLWCVGARARTASTAQPSPSARLMRRPARAWQGRGHHRRWRPRASQQQGRAGPHGRSTRHVAQRQDGGAAADARPDRPLPLVDARPQ